MAALIGTIITVAVTAYAASEQAAQQRNIARYNQKVAENTAQARRQAGQIEAENLRERQQAVMAAQRAGLGAAGILPSEGTPLLVQEDSAEKAALNEARVRYSAEVGARDAEAEAGIQKYYQRIANVNRNLAYVKAGTSLLSGVASYYGKTSGSKTDMGAV